MMKKKGERKNKHQDSVLWILRLLISEEFWEESMDWKMSEVPGAFIEFEQKAMCF